MLNPKTQIQFIAILPLFFCIFFNASAKERNDSLLYKNSVKLDLVPFYFDFFDSRVQARIGFEYERRLSEKSFIACYADVGLYDSYSFMKYYDFFNENQGMYTVEQNVSIIGFHIIPSYNYYILKSKKKPGQGIFSSAILDIGYYEKQIEYYNSQTSAGYSDTYGQTKSGAGLGLGFKYYFGARLFAELKTSVLTKIFNYISEPGRNPMMSLDGQWTSTDYRYWWISNIKIGYAF